MHSLTNSMAAPAKPIPYSYWVIPGKFLAGEHPSGRTPEDTAARVRLFLEAGFDCFVDLTVPEEREAYDPHLPRDVVYLRKPIPDHGTPVQLGHMVEILTEIEHALAEGRRVYVHCRAGIGRTGTVVGCHLVERGHVGDAALEELNRLWEQNERSLSWPEVPETPEQKEFVRTWAPSADPMQSPAVLLAARSLRERFVGALVGLGVGDAVAAHTQFRKPGTFTPVGDMLGGGPFDLPRGAYTDDTAMALVLAESLVERGGFDPRDQVARYARWQTAGHLSATGQCVGITASVARALAMAQYRRQPFAGSHDPEQRDKEPLSRVAPVVMFLFARGADAVQHAVQAARITNQAPVVLDCVRLFAAMVHRALAGGDKAAILRPDESLLGPQRLKPEVQRILDRQPSLAAVTASGGGGVVEALEAALWAFHCARDFREGALLVANLGEDSDVAGAVYGQLAGAYYGLSAIPGNWRNSLMRKAIIEDLADKLLANALVGLGE
jgi:ADP-ribosylglycohydrolase/protein-tyrosine phosphatase